MTLRTLIVFALALAATATGADAYESKADKYCKYGSKSTHGGMGATVHHDVISFRVWVS
jgi:hypothetical protein